MRCVAAVSVNTEIIASVNWEGWAGSITRPVSPSATMSTAPPRFDTTTGHPEAIASIAVVGQASGPMLTTATARAWRIAASTSRWGRGPTAMTPSPKSCGVSSVVGPMKTSCGASADGLVDADRRDTSARTPGHASTNNGAHLNRETAPMAEEKQRDGRQSFAARDFTGGGPTHAISHGHQEPRLPHLEGLGRFVDDGLIAIKCAQQVGIFIVLPDLARMRDGSVVDEHEDRRP